MKLTGINALLRHLRGRAFVSPELERRYVSEYRLAGVRVGYIFSWMAALSFVVFSIVEYYVLGRGAEDMVQRHRAIMILFFSGIGLHAKFYEQFYERIYEWVVPPLILVYAIAILYFESNTQMAAHPEFFYLSVTSTCLLLTIAAYYFMRLPIYVAAGLSVALAAATFYFVRESGVFNATVAGRMLTYIGVSNAVGLCIRIMFDLRERKIFLQNYRLERVSALRKRMMLAELSAHQAKTKLLAMVSHEMRTPMNTVARLMSSVKRDLHGQLTERRLEVFRQVEQACEHLVDTLDDLLHYSAGSAQSSESVAASAFMLDELVQECGDLVALAAEEKAIMLNIDISGVEDAPVLGAAHQLKRVLLNLLGNAIKFTSQGEVRVIASLQQIEQNTAALAIAVQDTGIGIPSEELTKIFQLFYQVDSSYSRRFGGTGLGLAISQRMVESMGGGITVESAVGKGSTFTVNLKLPMAAPVEKPTAGEMQPSVPFTDFRTSGA